MISFSAMACLRLFRLAECHLRRLDRTAQLLPGAEAALDMGDRLEAHALGGLGSKRRAQSAGAEEHEALVLREGRLVIGALRVDPEFQHAARAMEGAGHLTVALQFADVADIDQHHVVATGELDRLLGRQGLDFAVGGIDQRFVSRRNCLRHGHSFARMVTERRRRLKPTVERRGTSRHHGGFGDATMAAFTLPDLLALAWFLGVWLTYSVVIERTAKGRSRLNALMNGYRDEWMEQLLGRNIRMVDAQVTAALQNGTAFFASTSLIAIGGTLTLLRSTDEILTVVAVLPFGTVSSRALWDLKMLGLAIIFVYAFFKFSWSYRLFNYFAIMVGAAPPPEKKDSVSAQAFAHRAARLCADAGRHFNRGQRAFFFALGYLGWFLGPLPLALTTTGILIVMWRRQFASDARLAFSQTRQPDRTRRKRQ